MIRKVATLFLFIGILSGVAAADYVGIAPGVQDLGTVERGETRRVNMYIVTNVDNPFTINPSFERPGATIFRSRGDERYDFRPENASQEDISSWVEFTQDSYAINPGSDFAVSLAGGGTANAKGTASFLLRVPEEAEPGYHAGAVNLNPDLSAGQASGGAAVQTLGLTQFVFVFRVPGPAKRDVEVIQVNGIREGGNSARIDYLLKNQGTVTVRINRADTHIFDKFGNQTGTLTTGGKYLKPGKTRVVQALWRGDGVEEGDFRIRGEMNYVTGKAFIDDMVSLSNVSVSTRDSLTDGDSAVPWWMVLMVLVLVGVLLFYMDIDPIWISVLTGIAALVAFLVYLGVPTTYIGALLTLTLLITFYRWLT